MRDTMIVFVGMGILFSLPSLFYAGRCIMKWKEEKGHKNLYYGLGGSAIVFIIVILLVVNVYGFTIKYQAPLVAEQFLDVFTHGSRENLDGEEYLKRLIKGDLVEEDYIVEDYSPMEDMGIVAHESLLYLGENIYENEDGTSTQYAQFTFNGDEIFTAIKMKSHGNRWKIQSHHIISDDIESYPETEKRFYPIK